jgi:hypothetical protein
MLSINLCIVECNVFADNGMPPRKLATKVSVDMPCIKKEKVGFHQWTLKVRAMEKVSRWNVS